MSTSTTNYFSHKLEFNLNQKPAKVSDRISWCLVLPSIIAGVLLCLLGTLEMIGGFRYTNSNVAQMIPSTDIPVKPLLDPIFFDVTFVLIGLGMIFAGVLSYLRYRKFIFDGKQMIAGYRNVFGSKRIVKESIKNYLGVRFRIVFYQFGIKNANKYIIELCHKDASKNVPLYISMSPALVRKKWKEYARFFNLPALVNTDEGLITINLKDLDKSLKQMYIEGLITDDFDSYEKLPDSIRYVRRRDKIVIKRKNNWDIYNLLAWVGVFIVMAVMIITILNFNIFWKNMGMAIYGTLFVEFMFTMVALFILFRKEKLVLKKYKIVNTHKYMLFSTKHNEIFKDNIEAIDVTQNPTSGRYFVSIISGSNTITFGAKLPIDDLKWVKRFLIHEVVK